MEYGWDGRLRRPLRGAHNTGNTHDALLAARRRRQQHDGHPKPRGCQRRRTLEGKEVVGRFRCRGDQKFWAQSQTVWFWWCGRRGGRHTGRIRKKRDRRGGAAAVFHEGSALSAAGRRVTARAGQKGESRGGKEGEGQSRAPAHWAAPGRCCCTARLDSRMGGPTVAGELAPLRCAPEVPPPAPFPSCVLSPCPMRALGRCARRLGCRTRRGGGIGAPVAPPSSLTGAALAKVGPEAGALGYAPCIPPPLRPRATAWPPHLRQPCPRFRSFRRVARDEQQLINAAALRHRILS
ncbi:hypothetical protein MRX96_039451 [Rhipicephalus microplus]